MLISKSLNIQKSDISELKQELKANPVILARYVSDFDQKEESEWWYVVKDSVIDLNSIKSKYRNEINKGLQKSYAKKINPIDYYDEIKVIFSKVISGRKQHDKFSINGMLCERIENQRDNIAWWGVFLRDSEKMVAFAIIDEYEQYVDMREFFFDYEFLKLKISNTLVYSLCFHYLNEQCKKYISDGERCVNHPTTIQDYLIRTFGFRKAYCKLHIIYKNDFYRITVGMIYPFRFLFRKARNIHPLFSQINSLLQLETISRTFK
ncbi:hypothetical protein [Bacteroides nordii]|uniref:hypothetical protein n=1 Tax=Bacteroides nordii TaxID=291645 RepID=UPI0026DB2999|nr:hypothetical protein [Bacteroides nordii]